MDANTLADLQLITGIGQNVTVAGVLIIFVVMFVRGDIVSKKTMQEIIAGVVSQIDEKMESRFDELGKKIAKMGNREW